MRAAGAPHGVFGWREKGGMGAKAVPGCFFSSGVCCFYFMDTFVKQLPRCLFPAAQEGVLNPSKQRQTAARPPAWAGDEQECPQTWCLTWCPGERQFSVTLNPKLFRAVCSAATAGNYSASEWSESHLVLICCCSPSSWWPSPC